jgi:hypothetical protein
MVCEAAAAGAGLLPESAEAYGVRVSGLTLTLRFCMGEVTDADSEDIDEVVDEFSGMIWADISLKVSVEAAEDAVASARDGTRWVWMTRRFRDAAGL